MTNTSIIHLSDLHFKTSHNSIIDDLSKKIAAASLALTKTRRNIIIAVSGDLAFSGQESEYQIFDEFINKIEELMVKSGKVESISFIAVPGNHDCDFGAERDVREYLISAPQC